MSSYFYEIKLKSTITEELMKFAVSSATDYTGGPYDSGFLIANIPRTIITKDSFLSKLPPGTARIFKMSPYTCYKWHVDSKRGCAINLLLSGQDSHCYFGKHLNNNVLEYQELKYAKDTYYLFNTEHLHTIINGSTDRYVLSLGYEKSSNFEDILKIIHKLNA